MAAETLGFWESTPNAAAADFDALKTKVDSAESAG